MPMKYEDSDACLDLAHELFILVKCVPLLTCLSLNECVQVTMNTALYYD
jgi:hypothetical protein